MKKKSGIFSFRVNDILTSILSALQPFLALPNDVLKRKRGTFFFGFKRSHERHEKVPFLQLEASSQKREKPWQLEVMFSKVRKRYLLKVFLKSLKKCKIVFSSHGLTDVNRLVSFYEFFCLNLLIH